MILEVALPIPLRRCFDYAAPDTCVTPPPVGALVRVPFGRQMLIGMVMRVKDTSELHDAKLRSASDIIEGGTVFPPDLLSLLQWAADYYQCPLGEAIHTALPALLRQGEPPLLEGRAYWRLTQEGQGLPQDALKRSPKQAACLAWLQTHHRLAVADLSTTDLSRTAINALIEKNLVERYEDTPTACLRTTDFLGEMPLTLNEEQQAAMHKIDVDAFGVTLIDGATGSGKTEIYLQAIERVLESGKQALVMVPEIGLTPQTLARFRHRFNVPLAVMHSGLNDRERLQAWLSIKTGVARILIGTRSALFTPFANLGLIIIDEEHDLSFKQQDGFRYNARDLAVMRAHRATIPLLLGSATPSLESLHNARTGRYHYARLEKRAGNALPPDIRLIDTRGAVLDDGFSHEALAAIEHTLAQGDQVLIFLNRRGYAPTLECHDCGWMAECPACSARLTVHQQPRHLHCHHCDHQRALPRRCPSCQSLHLEPLGQGTERSEVALRTRFPSIPIIRVDRDSTRTKHAMETLLADVHQGEPCILIGTQMLAKGHHFADVTLVVILDADAGLFSTDFRGTERMGQLLTQVSGRAGREKKHGTVIVQSYHSDHPLIQTLLYNGYHALADLVLSERELTGLPPFSHLALLRAESKDPAASLEFLTAARQRAEIYCPSSPALDYLGPLPAFMEKRGDRYRFLLQLRAHDRKQLHGLLRQLSLDLEAEPSAKRVRWAIDVDPQEMG